MKASTTLAQEFKSIVGLARYAPSVHNTQPWLVSLSGDTITVNIDTRHTLIEGDPTGRQSIISLGIFCEALLQAAMLFAFSAEKVTFHKNQATLSLSKQSQAALRENSRIKQLLKSRSSDRSVYQNTSISFEDIERIKDTSEELNAEVRVITDGKVLEKVAIFTGKSMNLALHNPAFRSELSKHLVLPRSQKRRGIAVRSLYIPRALAYTKPLLMRWGWGIKSEVNLERKRWLSASAIVIILADGDLAKQWFNVGRAYLRASLVIEDIGLSQATSAAIVEASTYHEDIEAMLKTNKRILAMIRIGKGSAHKYHSPRVETLDLITSN